MLNRKELEDLGEYLVQITRMETQCSSAEVLKVAVQAFKAWAAKAGRRFEGEVGSD